MIDVRVVDMKHSSNSCSKQTRRLVQYSSGEDDSGAEDVYTHGNIQFRSSWSPPTDFKQKNTVSQHFLKQNRSRTGMIDNGYVNSFNSSRSEGSNARRPSGRLISSTLLPNSLKSKQQLSKKVVRHRSPIVRARLWSEHDTNNSGSVAEPIINRGARISCKLQQELCKSSVTAEQIPFSLQRSKNTVSSRKVLSDITKETVPDFRFQIPSYFSRDVLPVTAEDTTKLDDYFNTKNNTSNNNHFVKGVNCFNESTVNGILPRTRQCVLQNSVDMSKEFKTTEEKAWFSLHYQKVSMILVIFVLMFFIGVGLLYLNVRYKDIPGKFSDHKGNKYPAFCDSGTQKDLCINKDELQTVLEVLHVLSPHLLSVARSALCNSSSNVLVSISDAEVLDIVIQHVDTNAQKVLKNLKLIVSMNPHWDITILQENNNNNTEDEKDIDFLNRGRLAFKNPLLPIGCQIKLWFSSIVAWISSITAVFVTVSGVLFGLWDYRRRYEQHRQEVYMFVNKIISAVRNHHQRLQVSGQNGLPYLPVEVCRNKIFSTKPTQSVSLAWEDAVKFIDVHESRILTDILEIHGKPTKVWQWLNAASPLPSVESLDPCLDSGEGKINTVSNDSRNPLDTPVSTNALSSVSQSRKPRRNKVWQGQAFETIAGSPNSLPCSPTPCLKIRHMFDPDLEHGDDWPIHIEDSILEKCEDVCVLHLFVDCSSQEGCVFMKCSSPDEAGKAYRALHGWWFDTKLVTVKYLRVERYHERFPEAANVSSPLRPSNNQRLSLQELWHFPLEST